MVARTRRRVGGRKLIKDEFKAAVVDALDLDACTLRDVGDRVVIRVSRNHLSLTVPVRSDEFYQHHDQQYFMRLVAKVWLAYLKNKMAEMLWLENLN